MKILSLAIFVAAVSSTVIELETSPIGNGFAFTYTFVGGNGDRLRAYIRTVPIPEEYSESMLNITTASNEAMIVPNFIGERSRALRIVGTGFGTRFATNFANQWIMIPMHRQLIINPLNPSDFVYGGILGTTRSLNNDELGPPTVPVSVSILNMSQERNPDVPSSVEGQQIPFIIHSGLDLDIIPSIKMFAFINELESRGIQSFRTVRDDGSIGSIAIGDLSDELIDTLPTIQYHVHCDSGTGVIINLFGRDYVGLRTGLGRRRELRLSSSLSEGGLFGLPTLSNIALYIDNRNRTIGFGEPL